MFNLRNRLEVILISLVILNEWKTRQYLGLPKPGSALKAYSINNSLLPFYSFIMIYLNHVRMSKFNSQSLTLQYSYNNIFYM